MRSNNIYFSLGSNIGDRKNNLLHGINHLNTHLNISSISSVYETSPQGYTEQSNFYNLVCTSTDNMEPEELLIICKDIETHCGRETRFQNGPRELDIDIISYGEKVLELNNLTIPHPRMHLRLFVLMPLFEIAPEWIHPKLKLSIKELVNMNVNQGGIISLGALK
tara:strand:- start:380 stop:874 length:495 start_codon:yes stop_codon:yes gene_type:complete